MVSGLGFIPPWVVNAGILAGREKTLIIDTGGNTLGAQTIFGYASAVKPDNQLIVFNCEPHFDHIGGNGFFKSKGIEIYGHPDIQRNEDEFYWEKYEFNMAISDPQRKEAKRNWPSF